MRELLETTFLQALTGSHPRELTRRGLPDERPDLVLAVGKASLAMVEAVEGTFPDVPWLATPPAGDSSVVTTSVVTTSDEQGVHGVTIPGSHPLPDEHSVRAARRALELAAALPEDALLLLLVSGGGSALWSAPAGVSLEEKRDLTAHLQRAGADIGELNTVRRHLSAIKGGRLLEATRARVFSLLLSDVPGDAPWDIASGPGSCDPTTFADAKAVLGRFPGGAVAPAISYLTEATRDGVPDTPKPGSAADARTYVRVVGSSKTLLSEAASYLEREVGVQTIELHHDLTGEAKDLADSHAQLVAALVTGKDGRPVLPILASDPPYTAWRLSHLSQSKPVAILSGGEATVTVNGDGRGGRNQEFALALSLALAERAPGANVWALSAGSDGVDGSSDAAGAFITPDTLARARERGLDAARMLRDNDSHSFFAALGDQLVTGPTGHNLNDLRIVLLPPSANWRA